MRIDYNELSSDIGISNKTASNYLHYLEESFLVSKVYNFSRNLITSEKKLKKFYLISPSLCHALADFPEYGELVENFVISQKNYKFFWRDPYHHEVDFVEISKDEKIIPVEVKYSSNIKKKTVKTLGLFGKKFNCEKAVIYTKNMEEISYEHGDIAITERPVYLIDTYEEKNIRL